MSSPDTDLAPFQSEFTRFMMSYRFVTSELMTKINILADEFTYIHDYSPIEHVRSRLKSPESILRKLQRKDIPATLPDIRKNIVDIAGVRITCSFIQDTYRIAEMLTSQSDVTVTEVRDYIADPKPNGYKSLHLLLELPVFMSDRVEHVPVELQIRTIAMDFWASLEHKIFYRYGGDVPQELLTELTEAADAANRLDMRMEHLHEQVARTRVTGGNGNGLSAHSAAQELFEALAQHHRFTT
ncbi:GTP pyrophosphokinase family protein [Nocardia sp. NPDC051832]|uniref:GTP pyrophosphokinase n=1 Tax=Nocardia sp. NPDC051832 TaxID=3155673 RepID=UPI00342CF06B